MCAHVGLRHTKRYGRTNYKKGPHALAVPFCAEGCVEVGKPKRPAAEAWGGPSTVRLASRPERAPSAGAPASTRVRPRTRPPPTSPIGAGAPLNVAASWPRCVLHPSPDCRCAGSGEGRGDAVRRRSRGVRAVRHSGRKPRTPATITRAEPNRPAAHGGHTRPPLPRPPPLDSPPLRRGGGERQDAHRRPHPARTAPGRARTAPTPSAHRPPKASPTARPAPLQPLHGDNLT